MYIDGSIRTQITIYYNKCNEFDKLLKFEYLIN